MSEWGEGRLGDVTIKIGSGATPRGGKNSYKESGIALIRSMNVYDFAFIEDDLAFIDEDQAAKLSNVEVHAGDVLINITGASVARTCLAPLAHLPARVNQHVAIVRPKPELVNAGFINAYLGSPAGKGRLLNLASNGATREALTKQNLEDFTIPLPPLTVQHKIAAILGSIDDLIENNRRRIEVLEEMAQAIYREWFVHFRFPGHENATFVDSPLGPIPEGWTAVELGNLAAVNARSRKPASDEVVRYLDISCLGDRELTGPPSIEGASAPGRARRCVEPGDVVWSMVRPNRRAHALLVSPGDDWIASTGLAVISPREVSSAFLFESVSSSGFSDYLVSQESGAAYPAVKPGDFEKALLVVPSDELKDVFALAVQPMHQQVWRLRETSDLLSRTRDQLLPKLVSGEIDVSDLDLDALLEGAV